MAARVRSQKTGEHERRRSDTGPVINEESNFQVGDLTSRGRGPLLSRATRCGKRER